MNLAAFLRYNTRHHLFFARDGKLPKLNPISSFSHTSDGKRTTDVYEPLWLFRLRQRLFSFAGHQRCGRRGEHVHFDGKNLQDAPDTWDIGPDGNRTCSYCGSIHPDDLLKICRLTLGDERYGIEGTTKSYKVYVKQPGVRNASEGAIKFYMQHAPQKPSDADQALFAEAVRVSNARFERKLAEMRSSGTHGKTDELIAG